jgi:hypothetical protein
MQVFWVEFAALRWTHSVGVSLPGWPQPQMVLIDTGPRQSLLSIPHKLYNALNINYDRQEGDEALYDTILEDDLEKSRRAP